MPICSGALRVSTFGNASKSDAPPPPAFRGDRRFGLIAVIARLAKPLGLFIAVVARLIGPPPPGHAVRVDPGRGDGGKATDNGAA